MPKIEKIEVSYRLGCTVQPEKFQSLSFSSGATLTVDISDTDGSFEAAEAVHKEYYDKLEETIAPSVVDFYERKGLGD